MYEQPSIPLLRASLEDGPIYFSDIIVVSNGSTITIDSGYRFNMMFVLCALTAITIKVCSVDEQIKAVYILSILSRPYPG